MKKLSAYFLTVLAIVLLTSSKSFAAEKVSVFVEGNLSALQEQIVNNAFMYRLSSCKDYTVFERNETVLKAITREHDYQVSGDVPDSQIRKIAGKYGVDYVIVVTVTIDDNAIYMSARLINVESGKVEKTVAQDRAGGDNTTLKNLSNNVAYRLLNNQSK